MNVKMEVGKFHSSILALSSSAVLQPAAAAERLIAAIEPAQGRFTLYMA